MTSSTTSEDPSVSFTGWASTGTPELKRWSYHPRPLGPEDVEIEISHSGVCGSDIHAITIAYGPPLNGCCIPGHEIIGRVVAKGCDSRHQIGELVGVGGACDACGDCTECKTGFSQMCDKRTMTYNDTYKDGRGGVSYGGYADRVRVNGNYAIRIPAQISPAEAKALNAYQPIVLSPTAVLAIPAAPLLCAGITTYAPLKRYGAGPGKRVGVMGIGGLGHLGIQWASAMKCDEVVAISTSDSKREEARKLGATKFVNSKNPEEMKAAAMSMDIILCTAYDKNQPWADFLQLVAKNGHFVLLAAPELSFSVPGFVFLMNQISLVGSLIGGKESMQEMLEFAATHNVRPWIEKMPMNDANAAIKHMMEGRPRYRIVMETEAASRV
ncbi:hypothetical protein BGZ75_002633 [Mortierella antarctica]|nr:hypothetical protein BGZ75_002633 [Mortierella antarctica]